LSKERVLVAMSGGVDSSTAAFLLVKSGYEVIGINMKLWEEGGRYCGLNNAEDARRVAHKLSIPLYTLDLKKEFEKEVVEYCWKRQNSWTLPLLLLATMREWNLTHLIRGILSKEAEIQKKNNPIFSFLYLSNSYPV